MDLSQLELSRKEFILLRWISVTLGGYMSLEKSEARTALKLQHKKLITIGGSCVHAGLASLTQLGKDYLNLK